MKNNTPYNIWKKSLKVGILLFFIGVSLWSGTILINTLLEFKAPIAYVIATIIMLASVVCFGISGNKSMGIPWETSENDHQEK